MIKLHNNNHPRCRLRFRWCPLSPLENKDRGLPQIYNSVRCCVTFTERGVTVWVMVLEATLPDCPHDPITLHLQFTHAARRPRGRAVRKVRRAVWAWAGIPAPARHPFRRRKITRSETKRTIAPLLVNDHHVRPHRRGRRRWSGRGGHGARGQWGK